MRLTTLVTRAPQILLPTAVLLFLVFLASPTFIDSVTSEGVVTLTPGYAAVLWFALILPGAAARSRRDAVVLLCLFLAHFAFLALPVLVVLRRFRPWLLRMFFCVLFVAGFVSMSELIGRSERVGFGVYVWLIAAVTAATFCLLAPDDTHTFV